MILYAFANFSIHLKGFSGIAVINMSMKRLGEFGPLLDFFIEQILLSSV